VRQAQAKRRAEAWAAVGHGLGGARVQARLGRRKGWEDGQADDPNRAKIARSTILTEMFKVLSISCSAAMTFLRQLKRCTLIMVLVKLLYSRTSV